MAHQESWTTRLKEYIANGLPGAPGQQRKGSTTFVGTLLATQTGTQAELARVKGSTQGCRPGPGRQLQTRGFAGNTRRQNLGRRAYGESAPPRVWVTLSRARDRQGQWETWALSSHRSQRAYAPAAEYARRCGCAQGLRDAKGERGFAHARIKQIKA